MEQGYVTQIGLRIVLTIGLRCVYSDDSQLDQDASYTDVIGNGQICYMFTCDQAIHQHRNV